MNRTEIISICTPLIEHINHEMYLSKDGTTLYKLTWSSDNKKWLVIVSSVKEIDDYWTE